MEIQYHKVLKWFFNTVSIQKLTANSDRDTNKPDINEQLPVIDRFSSLS